MNSVISLVNIDTHEYIDFPGFAQLQSVMRDICILHTYAKPELNLGFYATRYEFDLTKKSCEYIIKNLNRKYKPGDIKCKYYYQFISACKDAIKTNYKFRIIYQYTFPFAKKLK